MDAKDITARLDASRAGSVTPEQVQFLVELARVYEEMGVLQGDRSPALHRACPAAAECWGGIPEAARPNGVGRFDARSEKGSIFLPWVGPSYRPGGVAVLGMNLRYAGADWEFAMEHRIARDPAVGQEQALRAGRRAHGSYWATATMRDVAALLRSISGTHEELETREPAALAHALLNSARMQAVKCSPIGGRSSPTPAMTRNCPPRYLRKELAALRPAAVLAYGAPAHGAVSGIGAITITSSSDGFRRGTLESYEVFMMTHPAHGGWHAAHRALIDELKARPPRAS